jgi:hypothetical protein
MRSNVSLRDATSEFSPKRKDVQPPCPDAMSKGTYPIGANSTEIGRRWKGKFSARANAWAFNVWGAFAWTIVFTGIFYFFKPITEGFCAASFVGAKVDLAGARDKLLWDFARARDVILEESRNQLEILANDPGWVPKHSSSGGSVSAKTVA